MSIEGSSKTVWKFFYVLIDIITGIIIMIYNHSVNKVNSMYELKQAVERQRKPYYKKKSNIDPFHDLLYLPSGHSKCLRRLS